MPIYAYRCGACGHAKDVLQKLADPVLTTCPACGAEAFSKQVTAAGFQLKGSGWYQTDFRNNNTPAAATLLRISVEFSGLIGLIARPFTPRARRSSMMRRCSAGVDSAGTTNST